MSKDVPIERRIYIKDWLIESNLKELGIPIYVGSRGGKYIDRADLERRGISIKDVEVVGPERIFPYRDVGDVKEGNVVLYDDVQKLIDSLNSKFGKKMEFELIGGLAKRGWSSHDIDILIKPKEYNIFDVRVYKVDYSDIGVDEDFDTPVIVWNYDFFDELNEQIIRELGLKSDYRIDFIIELPDDVRQKIKEVIDKYGGPIYFVSEDEIESNILEEGLDVAPRTENEDIKYIILSYKGGRFAVGWLDELEKGGIQKNSVEVPPEFRVYIQSDEEEKYYRRLGVTIYEGSRGGKYVDIREVHEKESKNGNQNVDDIMELKNKADSILTKILTEHLRKVTDEEIKVLSDVYYKLNKARKNRMANIASGDINDLVLTVENFENVSLNGDQMRKIFLKDGSILYAKPVSNENLEPSWLPFNNVIGSRLLKLFSKGSEFSEFVPNISVVKVEDEIFVASEEVYGVLGGDISDREITVSITENTINFLVSGILTGLWDMNGSNFMVIPDKGLIIPFDLDFIGDLQEEVFIGPVDGVAFIRADGEINSKDIMERIIEIYKQYDNKIEQIVDSIIDEYVDYLLDVGLDDYDFEDIKRNFMSRWKYIGSVIDEYNSGSISSRDAVLKLGSDGYEYGNMSEILKADKVPARYRIYINSWQAQRLRRNGVKVYRGPRGGLYVDSRDLRRKNIDLEQEKELNVVDKIVSGVVDLKEISRELVNPNKYMAVRGELSKRIDYLHEKLIDYKLGKVSEEEYRKVLMEAFDLAYVLNMSNKHRDNRNLLSDDFKVMDLKKAGVKAGVLNAGNMLVFEMSDGSRVFAKKLREDFPDETVNSLVVPALIKVLVGNEYDGFIPTSRIIKRKDGIYIGLSEVYGLTFDDIYDRKMWFQNNDVLKLFLAAQYVMGLDDSTQNVFVDYKNGTVVQFDFDYAFVQRIERGTNHFADLVERIAGTKEEANEIKMMGIDLLVQNYDSLKKTLGVLRKYTLLEIGDTDELNVFNEAIDKAERWIDTVYNLVQEDKSKAVSFIGGEL